METSKRIQFIRFVLFSNGVVDLFAAVALFFPLFNLPLPGYESYSSQTAFAAGGWGIATLTLGVGRIWASYRPDFFQFMVALGLLESTLLTLYCLTSVLFFEIPLLQALLALTVGITFSILYSVSLAFLVRLGSPS